MAGLQVEQLAQQQRQLLGLACVVGVDADMLQLKRCFFILRFLLLLHGEDQHSAHRQRQQTDEVLRNGELPELGDLVVTGAMIMAGIPSMGRKCPHQPETTIAAAAAVGSRPRLTQVAMAMGAKTYTVPMVEPVRVASTLVRMQKAKISTKGLTLVPASCNGLADQTGQAGVAQSIGNADDACGHQDNGCADGVADLVEVHDAGDQDDAHGQTGDGVACVTDLALQDHAHNGEHKAEVGDELLILGQSDLLLTGVESLFLGLGNGVVRQDLVGQDAPHQEADGQAQVDQRELDQIDVCRNACAFQNGDHDAVLQSGVEGSSGWFAAKPAGIRTLDGGSCLE